MVPRMQLLLVEDDPTMQTTLQRALTRRGMEVAAVGDGKAALSQWVGRVPDAVVLDPGGVGDVFGAVVVPGEVDVDAVAVEQRLEPVAQNLGAACRHVAQNAAQSESPTRGETGFCRV